MSDLPQVHYFIKDMEIDPEDPKSVPNRLLRRLLASTGKKAAVKYKGLVHPETGERPRIELHAKLSMTKPGVEIRLRTDSAELRDWLKTKGIVIGEVTPETDAGEAA